MSGVVSKRRNGRRVYRWKQMGFTSCYKQQEFYYLFKSPFCENCGISNSLHVIGYGFSLTIAHVDHNKFNNHPSNLATLCNVCHFLYDHSYAFHFSRMLIKKFRKRATINKELYTFRKPDGTIFQREKPIPIIVKRKRVDNKVESRISKIKHSSGRMPVL